MIDRAPGLDGIAADGLPCDFRRCDRAGCTVTKPKRMIGMRMRKHDGVGGDLVDPPKPVLAGIDHDVASTVADVQG